MPKYDLNHPIYEPNGKVAREKEGDSERDATVRDAFEKALLSEYHDKAGQALPIEKKRARYKLWQRISQANGELDCTVEEAATLQECAAAFPTFVYGQLCELLDGVGK